MKLVSFRTPDGVRDVGLVDEDTVVPLGIEAAIGISPMRRLLLEYGADLAAARAGRAGRAGAALPLESVEIEPIVPDPGKIVAAPVNYFDHKAEMREDYHIDALGIFLKASSSVTGSGSVVRLPYTDRRFDQEGELAVVIGTRASHVDADAALDHVAGFTILLDMTMRGGEDRSTRKSFDTFTPVGPYLVTADEAGDPRRMRLRTTVSGTLRQDADVADLIWGVPELIAYASSVMVLNPGDIVTTGTPAGIGQVHDEDTISVDITNLGRLSVTVSSRGAVPCPTTGANRGPKPPESVTPVRHR